MHAEIMINVEDVESSSRWYQRLLGCQSGHGGREFEMLMHGERLLMMLHRSSVHDHPSSPAPGDELGAGVCIYLRVPDIGAIAARASELGLPHRGVAHNELAHQDELELRDPDGYFLTICGPAEWASPP